MSTVADQEKVLILDFGAQYAQLIARRVREQKVFCQLVRHDISAARVAEMKPAGLIFSGGPASVYEPGAPRCDPAIFDLGIPILGICYGMQLACEIMGGRVGSAQSREFGRAQCHVKEADGLFRGVPSEIVVWMSHGDQVQSIDEAFVPPTPFARVPLYILVGAVRDRAVVKDGQLVVQPQLTVTATIDHRFIDGFQGGVLAKIVYHKLLDPDHKLVAYLKATVTPEAAVLASDMWPSSRLIHTGLSGLTLPWSGSSVPPFLTTDATSSNAPISSSELRNSMAWPMYAGERSLRNISDSGVSRYRLSSFVSSPATVM